MELTNVQWYEPLYFVLNCVTWFYSIRNLYRYLGVYRSLKKQGAEDVDHWLADSWVWVEIAFTMNSFTFAFLGFVSFFSAPNPAPVFAQLVSRYGFTIAAFLTAIVTNTASRKTAEAWDRVKRSLKGQQSVMTVKAIAVAGLSKPLQSGDVWQPIATLLQVNLSDVETVTLLLRRGEPVRITREGLVHPALQEDTPPITG